ncbi:MAG: energy-coupled thiamine transporter ThiT [Clostridia bacterium]|nr:energy-coupled thiamine transporter ThiT [Clostridia bacterium]MBQ8926134.1 energy-coupled thiamine transporter ThiT [Clostridia bacterium]
MATKNRIDIHNRTFQMVFSAVMVALATVLSVIPVMQLPFGGSVTLFSQVPILTVSWLLGVPWGLASGLAYAILQILVGGIGNFSYVQGILAYIILVFADYLVPFTFLGFGGMFKRVIKNPYVAASVGTLLVCFVRFISHFVSGATIWTEYAPDTAVKAVLAYSASYNASYMIPETIISVVGICAVIALLNRLVPKQSNEEAPEEKTAE